MQTLNWNFIWKKITHRHRHQTQSTKPRSVTRKINFMILASFKLNTVQCIPIFCLIALMFLLLGFFFVYMHLHIPIRSRRHAINIYSGGRICWEFVTIWQKWSWLMKLLYVKLMQTQKYSPLPTKLPSENCIVWLWI